MTYPLFLDHRKYYTALPVLKRKKGRGRGGQGREGEGEREGEEKNQKREKEEGNKLYVLGTHRTTFI